MTALGTGLLAGRYRLEQRIATRRAWARSGGPSTRCSSARSRSRRSRPSTSTTRSSAPGSGPRPGTPPACRTPASPRSTTTARTTAGRPLRLAGHGARGRLAAVGPAAPRAAGRAHRARRRRPDRRSPSPRRTAGVVHRDVKPGNLMVRPDGVVKVTDFGIAHAAGAVPLTPTGHRRRHGVLPVARAGARAAPSTPASDVYALGVVAHECLTGRRPFPGDNPVAVASAHLRQPPPPLPDAVPAPVRDLVLRMLVKDPARRPGDAAEVGRTALAAARGPAGRPRPAGRPACWPGPGPLPLPLAAPASGPPPACCPRSRARRRRPHRRAAFLASCCSSWWPSASSAAPSWPPRWWPCRPSLAGARRLRRP